MIEGFLRAGITPGIVAVQERRIVVVLILLVVLGQGRFCLLLLLLLFVILGVLRIRCNVQDVRVDRCGCGGCDEADDDADPPPRHEWSF